MIDESNHKPNKIWLDIGSQFYNISIISWSQENDRNVFNT